MKRIFNWQIILGILLIVLSISVYFIHFLIFRDVHHIFIYLIGDIGFIFIEILLVTLVLHGLLEHREKKSMLKKLNMVIGVFFSETGIELLKLFSYFNVDISKTEKTLLVTTDWSQKHFLTAKKYFKKHDIPIDIKKHSLEKLKEFLIQKREFLLNLLGNPNLLEHESFTNLLWAVFHLTEELLNRKDFSLLPDVDYQHLAGDLKRAYKLLIFEWLCYMKHLNNDYPYLFSLAARTNPFDSEASVILK